MAARYAATPSLICPGGVGDDSIFDDGPESQDYLASLKKYGVVVEAHYGVDTCCQERPQLPQCSQVFRHSLLTMHCLPV